MAERDEPHGIAEVLSLLAHDLKNPLAAAMTNLGYVEGFVRDLDQTPPDPAELLEVREAMLDARLACDALQRFVSNLEVVARDLGRTRLHEPAPIELQAIADEIVARHLGAAAARRVRITVSGESAWALADRDPLLRAADNCLANAIQHAPAGSAVVVELSGHDAEVALSILDAGLVVPVELRERALSRDGQAQLKGLAEGRYGRGLALYSANVAAHRAGGRLDLGERRGLSHLSIVLPRFVEGT